MNSENNMPRRKKNRLEKYDYSSCGAYFITICTFQRQNCLWNDVGATTGRLPDFELSHYGNIVDGAIKDIPFIYPEISVDDYVIMPNHVHILMTIRSGDDGRPMVAPTPTVSRVVNQLKGAVSKKAGKPIWQKSFYDRVIRNDEEYFGHMKYIRENPVRLYYDELYNEKPGRD